MKDDEKVVSKEFYTRLLQSFVSFLITILIAFIAWQSTKWSTSIESLSASVSGLNAKMEVMITEMSHSSQTLNDHEQRLRDIERKKK